jgi:hypothetical protein
LSLSCFQIVYFNDDVYIGSPFLVILHRTLYQIVLSLDGEGGGMSQEFNVNVEFYSIC